MKFVPLHIVSGYSFLQSGLTIEKIGKFVKANDYFGMGLSDINVMYGVPEFIKMAEAINKNAIIGVDVEINNDHLCLYALNEEGYHNLIHITVSINKNAFTFETLKNHKNGLLCVIETNHGEFKTKFLENPDESFRKYLLNYAKEFDDNFYLGIEVTNKEEITYANAIRKFAKEFTYNLVAFPRIKYAKKDDAIVLKITDAIANNIILQEKKASGQEYFMKETDYEKIYSKEEIANTIKILESTTFDYYQKRGELMKFPVENSETYLKDLCQKELIKRELNEEYQKRLDYELSVINEMGYNDYFLIVQDYVKWAKEHGILVGSGRGSAAGSLVSYLLDITEIDPLKYDLQFERFLNPGRKTMPDIDVDFMDVRRDEVVTYMREKYGDNRVANIVTFQTILAKQALRDVGRVYNYPIRHIDLLSKLLTNKKLDLRESYKQLPDFKGLVDSDSYFLEIVSLASKIENLPRQAGLHAAGIVLNNAPLDESIPVNIDELDNTFISQYEMNYLEEQGFLKMDFLGLRNLTTIVRTIDLIKQRHPDINISYTNIPYDTPEIFSLICSGANMGLFQIETQAMARNIKALKPNCFNDVVALLALGRPGPMQFIPNYYKRKVGLEKINYQHPLLEPILKETYGIIVYQEQINKIAISIAGFTPSEADSFRRAVSKKDKDKLISLEASFVEGAKKKDIDEKISKAIFNNILKFANYGFNKSHSVAYSVIACRMAYLKAHYPLEFYAAILETSSSNDTKFNEYVSEMKKQNICVLSPNINRSGRIFIIEGDSLLFPLSEISGVNEQTVDKILQEREINGEFKDYFDFVTRMFQYKIGESQIEKLIDSGAFDTFYPSRRSMVLTIKYALQYAELNYSENGQLNLGISFLAPPVMVQGKDNPLENLDKEYECIGIMLSDNPLRYHKDLLISKNVIPISEIEDNRNVVIAGIIKAKKTINTSKGTPMAFVKIIDETSEIEVTVFPNTYSESLGLLEKNKIVIIQGHYDFNAKGAEKAFIADKIGGLED